MLPLAADRKLRRLVSELAVTTDEDVAAILSGLEERQREQVEALLAEYRGAAPRSAGAPTGRSASVRPPSAVADLSPWLADRWARANLDRAGADEASRIWAAHDLAFTMTPTALAALREAVEAARGCTSASPDGDIATDGWFSSLVGRLGWSSRG